MIRAPGTRWDGVQCRVVDGGYMERSGDPPGRLLTFEATGEVEEIEVSVELRNGETRVKKHKARVYARTGSRFVVPHVSQRGEPTITGFTA